MKLKKLSILLLILAACNTSKNGAGDDGDKPQEKPGSEELSAKCLNAYGLPEALLKQEIHEFTSDCTAVELPESSFIDHYKLKTIKAAANKSCHSVDQILRTIETKKELLTQLKNKKRAEVTSKYDEQISELEQQIAVLISEPILFKKEAKVFIAPVKRHRFVDELRFLEEKGLSYALDGEDFSKRKLVLASSLMDREQTFTDEQENEIENIFFCSLKEPQTKDLSYIEYKGEFNLRPFVKVFFSVLD